MATSNIMLFTSKIFQKNKLKKNPFIAEQLLSK